jgi:hypothetical protein
MFYLSINILFFLCVVFIIYLFFLSEIYMFDNIDDATTDPLEKEKIMQFFKTLLSISPKNSVCQVNLNPNRIRCLRILPIIFYLTILGIESYLISQFYGPIMDKSYTNLRY